MTRVVGIGGSQRDGSASRAALHRVLAGAEAAGGDVEPLTVDALDIPVFAPERPDAGDADAFREAVARADGLVVATPMYHGSYAGPVKNALDHLRVEDVEDATAGLVAVAGGRYPRAALDHLRSVMRALGAWTVPQDVAVPRADETTTDGTFGDEADERMERLGRVVVRHARSEAPPDRSPPAP